MLIYVFLQLTIYYILRASTSRVDFLSEFLQTMSARLRGKRHPGQRGPCTGQLVQLWTDGCDDGGNPPAPWARELFHLGIRH